MVVLKMELSKSDYKISLKIFLKSKQIVGVILRLQTAKGKTKNKFETGEKFKQVAGRKFKMTAINKVINLPIPLGLACMNVSLGKRRDKGGK